MGPGCQPKGFKRWEKHDLFKYEILIYERQLTDKEINEYELEALN